MIKRVFFLITTTILLFVSCKNQIIEVEKIVEIEKEDKTSTGAVSNIKTIPGNNTILLTWTNPNESDFYGTRISVTPISENITQPIVIEGAPGKNSNTIFNGLENDIEYTFTLIALDKSQNKSTNMSIKASPVSNADITPPKEISDFKTTQGNSTILLSWTNPSDSDFFAVELSSSPSEGTLSQNVILTGAPSENMSFTVSNLENDKEYNFTLKTLDKSLNKSTGSQKTTKPVDDGDFLPPNEVLNFTTTVGNSAVILSWQNPSDSDFYAVEISATPAEGTLSQNVILTGSPSENMSFTVSNLANNKEYDFTLYTLDKSLNKSEGSQKAASPIDDGDYTPPANVTNISTQNKGNSILLTWTDATDSDIFGYEVSYIEKNSTRVAFSTPIAESAIMIAQGTEQCLIRNLTNEKEYTFIIKSVDTNGNKSEGATINATPHESKLSIQFSLQNDNADNIILTNDKAPVNVTFTSTDSIVKAVWKKGEKNIGIKPETLLSDNSANTITLDTNSSSSFFVTENGWYDIAAKDSAGRYEWEQIEIKTIDVTPLAEIKQLESDSDGEIVSLTWKETFVINEYESTLEKIKISYIYNDDASDSNNDTLFIAAGIQKATIPIATGKPEGTYMRIKVQTIDSVGNTSDGVSIVALCTKSTIATKDNIIEIISSMKKNGKVIMEGDFHNTNNENDTAHKITEALKTNSSILVELDLSKVTGLTKITKYAFQGCNNLVNIILPETTTSIEDHAFDNCTKLKSITIPANVTYIGLSFAYCNNLKIYYTGSLEQWCTRTWAYRNSTLPKYDLYIDNKIVKELELPNTLEYVKDYIFMNCTSLESVSFPTNITSIGEKSFVNCSNLKRITLTASIKTVKGSCFSDCKQLDEIYYTGTISQWCSTKWLFESSPYELYIDNKKITDLIISDEITKIEECTFSNCCSISSVIIQEGVKEIATAAFASCTNLVSIYLPSSIEEIGSSAFSSCEALTSITIPNKVKSIRDGLFYNCHALSEISLGNITSIEDAAFYFCSNLTEIIIPNTVTNIGDNAFRFCYSLKNISFEDTNSNWYRTKKSDFTNGELIGQMSTENANTQLYTEANACYYYYNDKYQTE